LAHKWKELNDDRERLNKTAAKLKLGINSFDEDAVGTNTLLSKDSS
jgi:hypothetical protein